ncbi:TPA: mRNA surveillance protein pelota [Candidatus Micrarchaeota archaeon]|nr:mRNA surveillance protein pelota [Candidatus Micrarchaeota archaeon]
MRIILRDMRNNLIVVVPENLNDLWHLSKIIEPGDQVKCLTSRKVKTESSEDRQKMKIAISLEKWEFSPYINRLRLTGKMLSSSKEDMTGVGSYHTLDVELDMKIDIVKQWKGYQIKRLEAAARERIRKPVTIVLIDDEKAVFGVLRGYGIEVVTEIYSRASKGSDTHETKMREFLGSVTAKACSEPNAKLVIAGPGFAKENLCKFIGEKHPGFSRNIIMESVSYAEVNGFEELLNRGVIEKLVGEERLEQEAKLLTQFLATLGKGDGLGVYGKENVATAVNYGAARELLVLDNALRKDSDVQGILEQAEKTGATILIYASESASGKQLESFKGLAAILRYKIS